MIYTKKRLFLISLLLLILAGCDLNISSANYDNDSNTTSTQGRIYYKNGELFGVTKEKKLNIHDSYDIISSKNGNTIGQISLDHVVTGKDADHNISSACVSDHENDFDADDYLVGSCTMTITK